MKIPYQKKRDVFNLVSALLWGAVAGYGLWKKSPSWEHYGALVCSIGYLFYYLFDKRIYYLTLKNGNLRTRKRMGKKISLSEITEIEKTDSKLVLKTNKSKVTIDTKVANQEALSFLKNELKGINIC